MKNFFTNIINSVKKSKVNQSILVFVTVLSILGGSVGFALYNNSGLTAMASDEPFRPVDNTICNPSTPTSSVWNPYPINVNSPSPLYNTRGNCQDIPLLSFFPIERGNPREKTIRAGENLSLHLYYNPEGPTNTINTPRLKTEIIRESDTSYRITARLEGGNVATATSAEKGGDLILNVPAGYRLEAVGGSGLWYPEANYRYWMSRSGHPSNPNPGRSPREADPSLVPSTIVRFDDATKQPASTNGANISYTDSDRNGRKDAGAPDSLAGGFDNYGYYLLSLTTFQEAQPVADLSLTKTVNKPTPAQGEEITYTINVKNNGTDNSTGVTVKDTLPTGVTYVSSTPTGYDPTTGIWTVGNLNVNETKTLEIKATVNNNATGTIRNIAQVQTSDQEDPNSTPGNLNPTTGTPSENDEDDVVITIQEPEPIVTDLELNITVNNPTPVQNTNIEYTITVKNTSTVDATGVTVKDTLPTGLQYVSATPNEFNNTTGIWTVGNLNSGETKTLKITAKVIATGTITNTAQIQTASPDDVDSTPGNNIPTEDDQDSVDVIVTAVKPQLSLDKSIVSPTTANVRPGDEITYRLTFRNIGQVEATNVKIQDFIDADVTYVEASCTNVTIGAQTSTCSQNPDGTLSWEIGSMPIGSQNYQVEYKVTVKDNAGGTIDNLARLTADELEPIEDSENIPVIRPNINLQIQKTITSPATDSTTPGSTLTYRLRYRNTGDNTATGVVITDYLDPDVAYVEGSCSGDCSFADSTLTWNIGDLAPSTTFSEVTYQVKISEDVSDGETIRNTAVITDDLGNKDEGKADIDIVVDGDPELKITKRILEPSQEIGVKEGDVIIYSLRYENTGNEAATGVVITDELSEMVTYINGSCSRDCTFANGTLTWNIGDLEAGQARIVSYRVTVNEDVQTGDIIKNTAVITDDQDNTDEDEANIVVIDPIELADLSLTKTVNKPNPAQGEEITYTINVKNNGTDNSTGVTVKDTLPTGVTYVSSTPTGYDPTTGIWTVGNLNVNETKTLEIKATVNNNATGTIRNIAQVQTSDQEDPNSTPGNLNPTTGTPSENDEDDVVITIPADQTPTLEIQKSVNVGNGTNVTPGQDLTYTITLRNTSSIEATGVKVTDQLDSDLTFISCSNNCQNSNGLITWNNLTIPANSSLNLTLNVKVNANASGEIRNMASIVCPVGAENCCPNGCDSNEVINPCPTGNLELRKSVDDTTASPNQTITYTITYTNRSNKVLTEAKIIDNIPNGIIYVAGSCQPECQYDNNVNRITWQIGTIAPNASGSVSFRATISGSATGSITNIATIDTKELPDVNAEVTTTVTRTGSTTPGKGIDRTTRTGGLELTAIIASITTFMAVLFGISNQKKLGFKNIDDKRISEE